MSLQIIIRRRDKAVMERLTGKARLDRRPLLQGIIVLRERIGIFTGIVLDSGVLALLKDSLQSAKRIQGPWETRVGI